MSLKRVTAEVVVWAGRAETTPPRLIRPASSLAWSRVTTRQNRNCFAEVEPFILSPLSEAPTRQPREAFPYAMASVTDWSDQRNAQLSSRQAVTRNVSAIDRRIGSRLCRSQRKDSRYE